MADTREKLIEAINEFFGCDAAYYDVNPFDLATHLIAKGVTFAKDNNVPRKYAKGYQPFGWKAFVKACPTCKNQNRKLCKKCKMEVESGYDPKDVYGMTNADRIRAMSDEELAEDYCKFLNAMLSKVAFKYKLDFEYDMEKGKSIMLKYLQQPAEGE